MVGYKHFEKINYRFGKDLLIQLIDNIIKYKPARRSEEHSSSDQKLFNNCNRQIESTAELIYSSFTFSESSNENKWYIISNNLS